MNTGSVVSNKSGLKERLDTGPVIYAEGYLFELERRGYLQAGPFVPEVVIDHPEVVTRLHEDFVHAGSDVAEVLAYYAHAKALGRNAPGSRYSPGMFGMPSSARIGRSPIDTEAGRQGLRT